MQRAYQDPRTPSSAGSHAIQDRVLPRQTDRLTSTRFFAITAGLEAGAGLALLVAPALVIAFLFGSSEIETAIAIGRLAGAALLSLGAACWGARHDAGSAASRALVNGLLIYNTAVVALAFSGSFGQVTLPLWPAVLVHGAMAVWCLRLLRVSQ
jgi:hypothetical protein